MTSKQNKPKKGATNEPAVDTRERIARRAYEIYLERSGEHGRDFEDWVQAEREVIGSSEKED